MRAYSLSHWHDEPDPLGPRLLRPGAAAAYLGISGRTLACYRLDTDGPAYVRLGPTSEPRYTREALDVWITRRTVNQRTAHVPALVDSS